jgi:hypothetical protein
MLIQLLAEHPEAALTIVHRTPLWVWGLLIGLVGLGLSQWRDRQISLRRAVLPSLGLAVFGLFNLTGDLRGTDWIAPALSVWLLSVVAVWTVGARYPLQTGTRYDPASQRFHLPGSALPLLTILAIFFMKYAVGVELAMQPELRHNASFSLGLAALYGALTGLFALRPLKLWRLARQHIPLQA